MSRPVRPLLSPPFFFIPRVLSRHFHRLFSNVKRDINFQEGGGEQWRAAEWWRAFETHSCNSFRQRRARRKESGNCPAQFNSSNPENSFRNTISFFLLCFARLPEWNVCPWTFDFVQFASSRENLSANCPCWMEICSRAKKEKKKKKEERKEEFHYTNIEREIRGNGVKL